MKKKKFEKMKIAIYIRQYIAENESILQQLFSLFTPDNQVYIEQEILSESQLRSDKFNSTESFASFENLNTSYDVILTIGGDGILLEGTTYVRSLQIPILGINAGRLGFLATAYKDDLPNVLEQPCKGDYQVVERSVIEAVFVDTGESADTVNFALNEITVTRKSTTSMITVDTELNGDYLCSYWADELTIATPTGSTGYSLSCAGPIILPTAENSVLTPITPHSLSARPVIIPEDAETKLSISGHEKKFLVSLDSYIKSIPSKQSIIVKKALLIVKMIRLKDDNFIRTLRTKLLWGEDKRNK